MVMSAMREKTKVVLFIALVAFVGLIFFDWGMQKSSTGGRGRNGPLVGKVNVQTEPTLMMAWGVLGWPTFVLIKDGSEVDRVLGPSGGVG